MHFNVKNPNLSVFRSVKEETKGISHAPCSISHAACPKLFPVTRFFPPLLRIVRNLTEPTREGEELDLKPGGTTDGRTEDDEELEGEVYKIGERKMSNHNITYEEYINTKSCINIPGLLQVCPVFKSS
jgi:hypothetical protein